MKVTIPRPEAFPNDVNGWARKLVTVLEGRFARAMSNYEPVREFYMYDNTDVVWKVTISTAGVLTTALATKSETQGPL
jgi:hypothetical protein